MSATPRTDAAYFEADEIEHATDADVTIAMRDFARELECENARLRASLIGLAYWARSNAETRASLRDRIDAALSPANPDSHEPKN
jgi:hypothetical protein